MDESNKQADSGKKRGGLSRAIDIALRSVHIGMAGVLLGAVVFRQPSETIHFWAWWTIATGSGLVASELYHTWRWIYQGGGVLAMLHIGCAAILHVWQHYAVHLLWAALIIGAVGSHMPRKLRHWSFMDSQAAD